MKFFIKICTFVSLLFALSAYGASVIINKQYTPDKPLVCTTYSDYFPFGYYEIDFRQRKVFKSVFEDILQEYNIPPKNFCSYRHIDLLQEATLEMKSGKVQLFMGAFYLPDDFDFIYPALLNNPVHLMMLPDKIDGIHHVEDLKKLKGIYLQNEPFSPHIINIFKQLSLTSVDNVDDAYRRLLIGEADYMLGSYFYQYPQVLERGLKGYIAFSARPLWNMPMFFALSKSTKNAKEIHEYFRRIINKSFQEKIMQRIKELIEQKEQQTIGIVPPTYANLNAQQTLTPADETSQKNDATPKEEQ